MIDLTILFCRRGEPEMPLSAESWMSCSIKNLQIMETWFVKFQTEGKTPQALLWEESVVPGQLVLKNAVTNKRPESLKPILCFAWTKDTGHFSLKNHLWLKRDQQHWGKIFWDMFSQDQHTEYVFHMWPSL